MKKFISLILIVCMVLSFSGCAEKTAKDNKTQNPEKGKTTELYCTQLIVNGEKKDVVSYRIGNEDYFSIFDIAKLVQDTPMCFDVKYHPQTKSYTIVLGTTPSEERDLIDKIVENPTATETTQLLSVFCDLELVFPKSYEIEGNHYFSINDIGRIINFNVEYSEDGKSVYINTDALYTETSGSEISFNEYYLTLIGKTKKEIDGILGYPIDYYTDFGVVVYSDGDYMIGYNTLGTATTSEAVPSGNKANVAYIRINKLFNNCPDSITVSQLKAIFPDAKEEYNEMDGYNVLSVNYNGLNIGFEYETTISESDRAFIKADAGFVYNPTSKTVNIENKIF